MNLSDQYIAGFFDGEGCVTIDHDKKKGHHSLRVRVSQVRPEVLLRIQDVFEGSICPNTKYGSVHILVWWDGKAAALLRRILPHLVVKKEEAKVALDFFEYKLQNRLNNGQPQWYRDKVKATRCEFKARLSELKHTA